MTPISTLIPLPRREIGTSFPSGGRATRRTSPCRNAIEDAIRQNFDGMHLDKNCITPVLEE